MRFLLHPSTGGHVLALRVFKETLFGNYKAIWHRTPDHHWLFYIDCVEPEFGCPRCFGQRIDCSSSAKIELLWIDTRTLRIQMDEPRLEPHLLLGSMNHFIKRILRFGHNTLQGIAPNNKYIILLPQQIQKITVSTAILNDKPL